MEMDDGTVYNQYTALDFVLGLLITIAAALANALGLNISKLDFARQEQLEPAQRVPDYKRPLFFVGLVLYIASQVVGSTLALEYLRAEYVAPLGATSLVWNFLFAYMLVGTPVSRLDLVGTVVIVLGVVGTVAFGNVRKETDFDKESNLSISLLKQLWGRLDWIVYLAVLESVTVVLFWLARIMHEVCMARVNDDRGEAERDDVDGMLEHAGGRRQAQEPPTTFWERCRHFYRKLDRARSALRRYIKRNVELWAQSKPDATIRKVTCLGWALAGGILAGQTLVFAKSAVKLVTTSVAGSDPNGSSQFTSPLAWIIIILLVVTAITQVYCLNKSLKAYDSTFGVPIFFATYTTFGFVNSLVYLDELDRYETWTFACIWVSIAVLISGVVLLSLKKTPATRKRGPSYLRDEELPTINNDPRDGPAEGGDDEPVVKQGPRQGWLAKYVPSSLEGSGSFPTLKSLAKKNDDDSNEMSARQRRNRDGVERLDDDDDRDSVFDNDERGAMNGDAVELGSIKDGVIVRDARARDDDNDDASIFDEDDFGDFNEAAKASTTNPMRE